MNKKIGGDFNINIKKIKITNENNKKYFSSGRAAFRAILRDVKANGINKIFIPDYSCSTVVEAARKENFEVIFFKIAENLLPEEELYSTLDYFEKKCVLIINYFGLVSINSVVIKLKEKNCIVILDFVQAFFEKNTISADYCFWGYRKFFPVPEGAYAKKGEDYICSTDSESYAGIVKTLGATIKNIFYKETDYDELYLNILKIGEEIFDNEEKITSVSPIFYYLVKTIDLNKSMEKRRNNFKFLLPKLIDLNIHPLIIPQNDTYVPLFLPVLLKNRDDVRNKLYSENVFFPIHWLSAKNTGFSSFLRRHELSIVIDQRYNISDMNRVLDLLIKYKAMGLKYVY